MDLAYAFKSMVATKKNLTRILNLQPQILHISCHGVTTKESEHLVFETENGEAYKMGKKVIETELKNFEGLDLELVFVAAC